MRITDQLEHASEDILRALVVADIRIRAMRDAMAGQPGAQGFEGDRTSGHTTVYDEHGIPMPAIADPTGEAGILRALGKDAAANDHAELKTVARNLELWAARLIELLAHWEPTKATIDRMGIGRCTDCRRYFDGERGNRISAYKGGDPVCQTCRVRRDRVNQQVVA